MFEPIHNKNNYQYIVDQIKQLILDGELIVGDRLPLKEISLKCIKCPVLP